MRMILFQFALAAGGVWAYFHYQGHGQMALIGFLMCAPLLVRLLAPAMLDLIPALRRHARHSVHGKWQGKFYSFGQLQLRLFLVDDVVWAAAADLDVILAPPPQSREWRLLGADYGTIPGQAIEGCTEAGLMRLLKTRTEHRRATHDMVRFKWWLEHESLPNIKKNPATSAS
jgi:hypothetical protein